MLAYCLRTTVFGILAACAATASAAQPAKDLPAKGAPAKDAPAAPDTGFEFINTSFENASPLYWQIIEGGTIEIHLLYDHERSSPNRAAGHWHFEVQARRGSRLTLELVNFDNVWNGRVASPVSKATIAFLSEDGVHWRPTPLEYVEGNRLRLAIEMKGERLLVARLEPYRISDLEKLKASIAGHPLVEITPIGHTVQGRELEIIRVGRPDAPHRVLLRARAHAWEPGGNWVVEGIIARLLRGDAAAARFLDAYSVYVLPMANKDGVAGGRTRFNAMGKDLNRNWDKPAELRLAPENVALEGWLAKMIAAGKRPDLAIDFHNDESGRLHVSRPAGVPAAYLERMALLEKLLREKSWFTEGSTGSTYQNPGTVGEGLLARYGVTACIHELNANYIAGLKDYPTAANWRLYGEQLCEVFAAYFAAAPPRL